MDILAHNRRAWDHAVKNENPWTRPVDANTIAKAKQGDWALVLTPKKTVPKHWYPENIKNKDILCLASGGGQQASVLAAAGARVTLLDNSPAQLDQDRKVAQRESLDLRFILGDMADLSMLDDESFDLIFHPCSNLFVPDLSPVWRECARVLRVGGEVLTGFCNPATFIFDYPESEKGNFVVRYKLPYSDLHSLAPEDLKAFQDEMEPIHHSHSLTTQINGQCEVGLVLIEMFEDHGDSPLDEYMPGYIATRTRKLA